MRPELTDLDDSPVVTLLEGMLTVSVPERFTAKSLISAMPLALVNLQ